MKRDRSHGHMMATIYDIPWGGDCVAPVEVMRFRGCLAEVRFGQVMQAGWVREAGADGPITSVNSDALTNRRQIKRA